MRACSMKCRHAIARLRKRWNNRPPPAIFRVTDNGQQMSLAAHVGPDTSNALGTTFPINYESIAGATILDRKIYHVPDIDQTGDRYPLSKFYQSQYQKYRAFLGVPLIHENRSIGVIFIRRIEARPFTEKQIKLVKTFADQSVIA